MSFLLGLAGFLLTIGIIVIVHEGGHFFTAKFFNIKVTRFSFGMGPVLWRRRKGETEYCFSALPLGGYVRMADEADADLTEEDRSRLYTRQARWKRGLVLFAGPATNFVLAFFLYVMVGAIGTPDFAAVMGTPPRGPAISLPNRGSRELSTAPPPATACGTPFFSSVSSSASNSPTIASSIFSLTCRLPPVIIRAFSSKRRESCIIRTS